MKLPCKNLTPCIEHKKLVNLKLLIFCRHTVSFLKFRILELFIFHPCLCIFQHPASRYTADAEVIDLLEDGDNDDDDIIEEVKVINNKGTTFAIIRVF